MTVTSVEVGKLYTINGEGVFGYKRNVTPGLMFLAHGQVVLYLEEEYRGRHKFLIGSDIVYIVFADRAGKKQRYSDWLKRAQQP